MKKINKISLFIILLISPIIVFGSTSRDYNSSVIVVNNYLRNNKSYVNSWEKFLIEAKNDDAIISEDEYNSTKNTKNKLSYLYNEKACWTSTDGENGYKKVILPNGKVNSTDKDSNYTRVAEFIKPGTSVSGNGSFNNPWSFSPVYKVTIETTNQGQFVDGAQTISYVVKGGNAELGPAIAKEGYMYITNTCGTKLHYYDSNADSDKRFKANITDVTKETNCKLIFGTGKFRVDLEGASPEAIFLKYKDQYYDSTYKTPIRNIQSVPSRNGYEFKGYYYNDYQVIDSDLKVIKSSADKIRENVLLKPSYEISDLTDDTTISGGTTKVYNYEDVTITCSNGSTYDSLTQNYYEFGEKNADGSITWFSNPSTSNNYTIAKDSHIGTKTYTCRAYASDGVVSSNTKISTNTTDVTFVKARVDFNANGGSVINGTTPVYVSYNDPNVYSGRTSNVTSLKPEVAKNGYSVEGWYNSNNNKVIDGSGAIVHNVSGWTSADGYWKLTSTLNTQGTNLLTARYTANPLVFNNQSRSKVFSTAEGNTAISAATNGTGTYTYAITSGNTNNYFSLNTNRIIIKGSTPVGTYKLTIKATDSVSRVTKDAVYTINITPATLNGTLTISGNARWDETLTASVNCTTPASGCSAKNYKWYYSTSTTAEGTQISGATSRTYKIDKAYIGKYIYATADISATNYKTINDDSNRTAAISKRTLALTATAYSGTYNGSAHNATIKVTSADWNGKTIVSGTSTSYGQSITTSGSVNQSYSLRPGYTNFTDGSKTIYYKVTGGSYFNDYTGTTTVNINRGACNPPTNVAISTAGVVTWTASSNASSYQISINNSNFTAATSGINYKSTITASAGARTVYVRSVCDSTKYNQNSSNATKSINVYSVTLTKGTGIASVSGNGRYISGEEVTISATVSKGYNFAKWAYTSNNSQISTSSTYKHTISQDWKITASTTAKTYTVKYNSNGGSTAPGNQTATFGNTFTVTSTKPTKKGYNLATWKDPTNASWNPGWSGTWKYDTGDYGITNDRVLNLTASWTKKTFTVKYNANGGNGAPANQTATYGNKFTVSSTKPTKSGSTFVTWKDPTKVSWNPGWSGTWNYDTGDYGITSSNVLTLTAEWKSNHKTSNGVIDSYGNVNWEGTAFGFEIYLVYDVYYDGTKPQGTFTLKGYRANYPLSTAVVCGTFKFGNKEKYFGPDALIINSDWFTGSGPFANSGTSISWSWTPRVCNSSSGKNKNTWLNSKSGTISLN